MNDLDIDRPSRKARELSQASIPGDPFPWEPDPKSADPDEPRAHEDPADYDLGGGD